MTAIIRALACVLALLAIAPATAAATHWKNPEQAEPPPWEDETADPEPQQEHDAVQPEPQQEPDRPPHLPTWGDADGDQPAMPALPALPELPEPPEPPEAPQIPLVTTATIAGRQAMLRTNGKAAIPRGAPRRVRAIIAAANQIAGKPYKWGGGHAKLVDRGYDCSGTVSYALIRSGAGLLHSPMVSGSFARWGVAGAGRWVTVYANAGHVYLEVAGLRLDTSAVGDRGGGKGVRWRPVIGRRKGFRVRHPAGL